VGGSFTLRTASGSTSVAIDFTPGAGAPIKLGGTQTVGSATFDPLAAILDSSNYSANAVREPISISGGGTYNARASVADLFAVDTSQVLSATIVGFEPGDSIMFLNRAAADGAIFDTGASGDGNAIITAGNATINLTSLANDNFADEASFEAAYGASAIWYII